MSGWPDSVPLSEVDNAFLTRLLEGAQTRRASDVHLQVGSPPMARIDGQLVSLGGEALKQQDTQAIARLLLSAEQWEDFEFRSEMDTAYSRPGIGRFRCNLFRQRGSVGIVMRVVSDVIPSFVALGLPEQALSAFANASRGLVLVTGPTGSGKSTTLSALVDHINRTQLYNIITIEDPIEVLHRNQRSLVVQREVGLDTRDFRTALKFAMRQDPDVIMIGEMRDKETVEAAITAAQTGHLVISTLHTLDAVRTVNRIIDFFQPYERNQMRALLADSLVGIVSQRLLPRADGVGRALGTEVLVNTPLIQDYIRDQEKTVLIKDALMESNLRGMHTFDMSLVRLLNEGVITEQEAMQAASSPHEVKMMLTRQGRDL